MEIHDVALIVGSDRNDFILGRPGPEIIRGGGGDDFLRSLDTRFSDRLEGGAGDDFLEGGFGNDTLRGDAGNDSITGRVGNDILTGGIGNDSLFGGIGDDVVLGEDGNDLFRAGTTIELRSGHAGRDRWTGGAGRDIFDISGFNQAGSSDYAHINDFTRFSDRIELGAIDRSEVTFSISGTVISVFAENDLLAVITANNGQRLTPGTLFGS